MEKCTSGNCYMYNEQYFSICCKMEMEMMFLTGGFTVNKFTVVRIYFWTRNYI